MEQARLVELQTELARDVHIPLEGQGYVPKRGDLIFGLDAQYVGDRAWVLSWRRPGPL